MKHNQLKIRWFCDQCYEIAMPSGSHLVIDPGITACGDREANLETLDSIKRCDYILVTHSHYASTADLKILSEKFNPFIFLSSLESECVFSYYDLDYSRLHPLHHGQLFEMEDFSFTSYVGKHGGKNHHKERLAHMNDSTAGPAYSLANILGNVESYDFNISFENNLRLTFVSGEDDVRNTYSIAKAFKPNILIRQFLNWPIERYAKAIDTYGAEVAFTGHQDKVFEPGSEKYESFGDDVRKALDDIGSDTQLVCPKPGKWYTVSTCAAECD